MDARELLLTALRAFGIYLVMLVVVRALGKRTVGNFAAFDLLVALMLGEVVGFVHGTTAIVVIAALHAGNAWLTWWGHGLDTLLEGTPTIIVREGRLQEEGMRSERMNAKEVMGHLRAAGIQDVREVKLALVEDDGSVSVIRRPWAEPAMRADLDQEAASSRRSDLGGQDEPGGGNRTDASQWLR